MKNIKKSYIIIFALVLIFVISFGASYAIFMNVNEQHGKLNIVAGDLDYKIESNDLVNNQITVEAGTVKEITLTLTSLNEINSKYELYYTLDSDNSNVDIGYGSDTIDTVSGTIDADGTKTITVVIANNSDVSTTVTIGAIGGLMNNILVLNKGNSLNQEVNSIYTENILNGADPVLTSNLVPIQIADDGIVTKASTASEWYDYETKNWANAVVLKDETITYSNGDIIPDDNIESYFVWIPRYKYKIFNTGSYTGLTSIGDSTQEIEVVFENKETTPSNGTTVGSYLTHPAFTAFDTNGLWVGKFETGYDGATSTEEAQTNTDKVDISKIVIKPNVYSWRNITVGNAFKNSYDYLREQDSHMMKNTEWGAVAYLQHSSYGSQGSLRINNNSAYITGYSATEEPTVGNNGGTSTAGNRVEGTALGVDGTYTVNYLNTLSNVASTTGNKSGVYDMSGGAWEYVMGYTTGATSGSDLSEITSLYTNFYSNSTYTKYWDKYTSTVYTNYNYRKLGDATGEMGPFGNQTDPDGNTRPKSSWYGDYAYFADSALPWFDRGGYWYTGTASGAFAFAYATGGADAALSFRVVLAP